MTHTHPQNREPLTLKIAAELRGTRPAAVDADVLQSPQVFDFENFDGRSRQIARRSNTT
jgi:hypothetical protein